MSETFVPQFKSGDYVEYKDSSDNKMFRVLRDSYVIDPNVAPGGQVEVVWLDGHASWTDCQLLNYVQDGK